MYQKIWNFRFKMNVFVCVHIYMYIYTYIRALLTLWFHWKKVMTLSPRLEPPFTDYEKSWDTISPLRLRRMSGLRNMLTRTHCKRSVWHLQALSRLWCAFHSHLQVCCLWFSKKKHPNTFSETRTTIPQITKLIVLVQWVWGSMPPNPNILSSLSGLMVSQPI